MSNAELSRRIENELTGNILPFWARYAPDPVHGGFHGALRNDRTADDSQPRSAVVTARILWTFSVAHRLYPQAEYLAVARRAYDYIRAHFWDSEREGVYWSVDSQGEPLDARKHSYAQAFTIYGMTEYFRATGEEEALVIARRLFSLLEAHAHDGIHHGYIEGCGRDWGMIADPRLSPKEPDCRKSMNTLLHILEAYTGLLPLWEDPQVRLRLRELIEVFLDQVIDPATRHFRLFFHDNWSWEREEPFSYGHDVEGSWLLVEAAEALGDRALLERTRAEALRMAEAVLAEALQPDGRVFIESDRSPHGRELHWWVHAEAVVGFHNAYQLSGDTRFAEAAERVWGLIERRFVDREYGDWFKVLDPDGNPKPGQFKTGPWECPYHHARTCFEMIRRLA